MGMVSIEESNGSCVSTTIPCLICDVSMQHVCHYSSKKYFIQIIVTIRFDIYYVQFYVTFHHLCHMLVALAVVSLALAWVGATITGTHE